jgi:hypothetical protein
VHDKGTAGDLANLFRALAIGAIEEQQHLAVA